MAIRQIENLRLGDKNWTFSEGGIDYTLISAGKRFNEETEYILKSAANSTNDRYKIFGGGNLIKDNEAKIHFILNKVGTYDLFIICADDLNNEMIENTEE